MGNMRRKDDTGQTWTLQEVEDEVRDIVVQRSPGFKPADISRATKFVHDLGWDQWYLIGVGKPVRKRLHESLEDSVVVSLKTLGDLADYVWGKMEPA